MGQFQGQPDFGTVAAVLTPSDTISNATNLNSACIYVGGPAPIANITCILSGVTGVQGTVTANTIINGGTGYTTAAGVAVTPASGLGTGCTVNITAVAGVITVVAIATLVIAIATLVVAIAIATVIIIIIPLQKNKI